MSKSLSSKAKLVGLLGGLTAAAAAALVVGLGSANAGLPGCGDTALAYNGRTFHLSLAGNGSTLLPVTFNSNGTVQIASRNHTSSSWSATLTGLTFTTAGATFPSGTATETYTSRVRICDTGTSPVTYVGGLMKATVNGSARDPQVFALYTP